MKLEIKNINKSFSGKQVLHDISFTVTSGKAMGFLGRNGAGKTTTIRALMDVFKADSGEFLLDGQSFDPSTSKVGYLPEERGLYGKEKILSQLIYFGTLRGATSTEAKKSAEYWLERFGLIYAKNHKLETLSKGNQQKVQIAQALLNDPDIIIFDEPFSGLDPVNSIVLEEVIQESIQKGKLVIFSSHQMGYVEAFCDEITLIDHGHIILSGNLPDIKSKMGNSRLRVSSIDKDPSTLHQQLSTQISDIEIEEDDHSLIIELKQQKSKQAFLKECFDKGIILDSFGPYEPSLQEVFIKLVGEENA
jgi:ABC-2 type transport system ATP-binding protein